MRTSELTEALRRAGLSRHESIVFLNLARVGAATARELAFATGVNRVQTYRALEALEARGLVEVTLDHPKRFAARAVDEAFDMLAEEKRAELESLEGVRRGILNAWPKNRIADPSVRLQVIKGRAQIYRAIARLVESARKDVLAFTTTKGLQRSYRAGINESLVNAMRRGIKPRLVADIDGSNVTLMRQVGKYVPLRHLDRQRGRFIIVDRASVLVFLVQDEGSIRGDAEAALWTNSADFVKSHVDLFERAWAVAQPFRARIASFPAERPPRTASRSD